MFLTAALSAFALIGCGTADIGPTGASAQAAPQAVVVTVNPESKQLQAGSKATFAATVTGTATTNVTWEVEEGSKGGSVDADGNYTAPSAPGTFHLVAKADTGTIASGATATVASAAATVVVTAAPTTPVVPTTLGGVGWKGSTSLVDYPKTSDTTTCGTGCQVVSLDVADASNGNAGSILARFNYALGLLSSNSRVLLRSVNGGADAVTTVPLAGLITRSTAWSTNLVAEGDGKSYKQFMAYGTQRVRLDASAVSVSTQGPLLLNGQREHWKGFEITGTPFDPQNVAVAGMVTIRGSNNKVEDFLVHGNAGGAAAYVYGSNNVVQDVVGWDNGLTSGSQNTASPDGMNGAGSGDAFVRVALFNPRDDGIDLYECTNCKVIDCVSYGAGYYPGNSAQSGDGSGYKMGLTGPTSGNNQNIGSIAVGAAAVAFSLGEAGPYPVIYDHVTDGGSSSEYASFLGRGTGGTAGGDVVSNSIYTTFANGGNGTGSPSLRNNYTGSPRFADPANGDYSLAAGASAIGLGGTNAGASEIALQLLKDHWGKR